MRKAFCQKHKSTARGRALAVIALVASLVACTNDSRPVSAADFSSAVVGRWQGTVGDSRETMSLKSDGTFVCQLNQTGFIANMLYPVVPGTVSGTWSITGNVMMLKITGEKNERLVNKTASSVIVSFNENELVLKSNRGETSSFVRIRAL
jgi:hypothetical protein